MNASQSLKELAEQINAALPQTQCTQCGYTGCAPYAQAIAFENVPINQCPPGGAAGIAKLAKITGQPIQALNPENGIEQPRQIARIIEAECIGCTKCIQACPVDAIIGTSKLMHVVLPDLCTGCGLCVPPCPVDCIDMPLASDVNQTLDWSEKQAKEAKSRYDARNIRLSRFKVQIRQKHIRQLEEKLSTADFPENEKDQKLALVQAALARARARRS